jgi:hypothetical protein
MDKNCAWCNGLVPATSRADTRFCSRRCRQAAFRIRRSAPAALLTDRRLVMAYADPPYPGLAAKYYAGHRDYRGEVDHAVLLSRLEERRKSGEIAGWAVSTSSAAARQILSLSPEGAKLCVWAKQVGPGNGNRHDFWEALVVVPGRPWRLGFSNVLIAATARGGHDRLIGRKPLKFCAWLFDALGMRAGDGFEDLFPGTGTVLAAWREVSSMPANDASCVSEVLRGE